MNDSAHFARVHREDASGGAYGKIADETIKTYNPPLRFRAPRQPHVLCAVVPRHEMETGRQWMNLLSPPKVETAYLEMFNRWARR